MTVATTTAAPSQMMSNLVLAAAQVNYSNPEEVAMFARQLASFSAVSTMQLEQRLTTMQQVADSQHVAMQQHLERIEQATDARLGRIEQALVQLTASQTANVQAINAQGGRVAQGVAQVQEALAQVPRAMPAADGLKESTKMMMEFLARYVMNSAYGHVSSFMFYDEANGPFMVIGGYAVYYAFTRFTMANPPGELRKFRTQTEVYEALGPLGQALGGHETRQLFERAMQFMPYEPVTRDCSDRAQGRAGQRARQSKNNDKVVAVPMARFVYTMRAVLEDKPFTSRLAGDTLRHPRTTTYNVANTRYYTGSLEPEEVAQNPALKSRSAWNYRMWAEALRARPVREWVQLLRLLSNEAGLSLDGSEPCTCGRASQASSSTAQVEPCSASCLHGRAVLIRMAAGACSCGGASKCGVCQAVNALAWCAHRQVDFAKQKERELGVRAGMLSAEQLGDARRDACKPCHFSGMTLQPEVRVLSHRDTMARVETLREQLRRDEEGKKRKTLPYLAFDDEPVLYHIGPGVAASSAAAAAAPAPRVSDDEGETEESAAPAVAVRGRGGARAGGAARARAAPRARFVERDVPGVSTSRSGGRRAGPRSGSAAPPRRRAAARVQPDSVRAAEEESGEEQQEEEAEEDEQVPVQREVHESSSGESSSDESSDENEEEFDNAPIPIPAMRVPTPIPAMRALTPVNQGVPREPPAPMGGDDHDLLESEESSEEEAEQEAEDEEGDVQGDADMAVPATQLVALAEAAAADVSIDANAMLEAFQASYEAHQAAVPEEGVTEEVLDSGVVGDAAGEKRKADDEPETLFAFKRARN